MARQEDQLVKVLTLIDESLIDLKEGSKHQQSLGQPSSNVTTSYLNTLTRDLLEEQKQNSALAEENQLLRRRLEMQSGTHSQLSSAVGGCGSLFAGPEVWTVVRQSARFSVALFRSVHIADSLYKGSGWRDSGFLACRTWQTKKKTTALREASTP